MTMKAKYVWDQSYKAAILETDDKRLPNRLHAAKGAIDRRFRNCRSIMEVCPKNGKPWPMRLPD
jgi:hypothetical protein